MSQAKLYAIKAPDGALFVDTVKTSRAGAWERVYSLLLYRKYSHRLYPQKAAYKDGYRCVRVVVAEWRE